MNFQLNTDLSHFDPLSLWGLLLIAAVLSASAYRVVGRNVSVRSLIIQFVIVTVLVMLFCALAFQDSSGIYLSGLIQGAVYSATFIIVGLLTIAWKNRKESHIQ